MVAAYVAALDYVLGPESYVAGTLVDVTGWTHARLAQALSTGRIALQQGAGTVVAYPTQATRAFPIPALVWDAQHTLDTPTPGTQCFDGNGDVVYGDISYPSATLVRVSWAFLMSGSVRLT